MEHDSQGKLQPRQRINIEILVIALPILEDTLLQRRARVNSFVEKRIFNMLRTKHHPSMIYYSGQ